MALRRWAALVASVPAHGHGGRRSVRTVADGSFIAPVLTALLAGAVGATVGPIITAGKARKLWRLQQTLDLYADLCDYVETVDRALDGPVLYFRSPEELPQPPERLAGRIRTLASDSVRRYWKAYRAAIYGYDTAVSSWTSRDEPVEHVIVARLGLEMADLCAEKVRTGKLDDDVIDDGALRRRARVWVRHPYASVRGEVRRFTGGWRGPGEEIERK